MLHLAINRVPDLVVEYLTATARREGYTRAAVDPSYSDCD